MPIYCFKTPSGRVHEELFPLGMAPRFIRYGGEVALRDLASEHKGGTRSSANWPMIAEMSCAIEKEEVGRAVAFDKAAGVPTEYVDIGAGDVAPRFDSPHHRKRYCEAHKLFDRNAGFNDPLPSEVT